MQMPPERILAQLRSRFLRNGSLLLRPGLLAGLLMGTLTCCTPRKPAVDDRTAAWDQKLCLHLNALQELDLGNTESVRRMLADDCLQIVASIVEKIGSLDSEDLYKQSSLRSAASYWKDKPIPPNLPFFSTAGAAVSNRVFEALALVGRQLDMNVQPRPLRPWENHLPGNDIISDKLRLDLTLLPALDAGNTNFVRARLTQSCLGAIFWVAHGAGSSTDLLCAQPGLRAAAAYWATNPIPSGTTILADQNFSNSVYHALRVVQSSSQERSAATR